MRSRTYLTLIVILSLCCLGALSAYSQRRQTPTWEYKFVEIDRRGRSEKLLNDLASQGWELVTVQGVVGVDSHVCFLKRPAASK